MSDPLFNATVVESVDSGEVDSPQHEQSLHSEITQLIGVIAETNGHTARILSEVRGEIVILRNEISKLRAELCLSRAGASSSSHSLQPPSAAAGHAGGSFAAGRSTRSLSSTAGRFDRGGGDGGDNAPTLITARELVTRITARRVSLSASDSANASMDSVFSVPVSIAPS